VLAEVSALKADAPSFVPMLPSGMEPAKKQKTKLRSKANAFVPGQAAAGSLPLPFVPSAVVAEMWRTQATKAVLRSNYGHWC